MKVRKKLLVWLSVFLFCFSFLSLNGCFKGEESESADGSVTIKVAFWGSPDEIEIITKSIEAWEKEHPKIKIRFEHTPYPGYVSKILTRIAGGAAPDVICTEVNYFVSFVTRNVLEDMRPFINQDPDFSLDEFFPEVVDRFTYKGGVYAIPRDTAPFACVFYNKDLFDEAGIEYPNDDWTWNEMLEKAKALTKVDEFGRITQYGFYGWAWQNFIYGNGGRLVDSVENPTRAVMMSPETVNGLQFYADLINKYKVMPAPVALANMGMGVDTMFSTGRLAMFLSGIWESPALRKRDFRWDVAMFPKNPEGIRGFGTGGSGYCVLKSSKHKKEAWEVVKALTGPEGQSQLAERGLAQPARIEVAHSDAWAGSPLPPRNKGMLNEAVKYVVYDPFHPKWREAEAKYIMPELELAFNGRQTVREAMEKLNPKVTEFLQKS